MSAQKAWHLTDTRHACPAPGTWKAQLEGCGPYTKPADGGAGEAWQGKAAAPPCIDWFICLTRSCTLPPCALQLVKRDEEIDALRLKLRNVLSSSRAAEANRASQESLITSLQQRHEAEKQHKYTAIYALAERSKALEECNTHEHQLREELANCREAGVVAAQKVL